MMFSVVIPMYNKGPYIACTLQSVLAQNLSDLEVVVVDDGSNDNGPQIVAQCPDPRVRLLQQSNAGVAAARNRGIEAARGQWVCFLDADDWLDPGYLSALQRAHQLYPQADVLAADFVRVPHAPGPWPPGWTSPTEGARVELITRLARYWMSYPSLSSSSVAVRRRRLLALQPCFPVGESMGEDLDLWFRLAEQTPIALVHEPRVAYRVAVGGSLSSHQVLGAAREAPPFLQRLRQRVREGQLPPQLRRDTRWLIAQHELSLAREALQAGHRAQALRWLLRAHHALRGRRWWFTLIMIVGLPHRWITPVLRWRTRHPQQAPRSQQGLQASDSVR